jgi:hypothetical protein
MKPPSKNSPPLLPRHRPLSHFPAPRLGQFFTLLRRGEVGSFLNGLVHFRSALSSSPFHNVWHGIPASTVISWGLTIKSTVYFLFPRYGLRMLSTISPGALAVRRRRNFSVLLAGVVFYAAV